MNLLDIFGDKLIIVFATFFNAATVGLTEDSWIKKAINDSNAGWTKMPLKTDKSRSMNEATSVFKSHKTILLVPVLLILLKE